MCSQDGALDIAKTRRIFQATRSLLFADIPTIDLKDRVSVFTVAAGIRSIGVLETWGQWLPRLRDAMITHGLFTSVGTSVWSAIERPPDHPYRSVLLSLDAKRVAGKPKHVLWVYASKQQRDHYRQVEFTQQQAGAILGYPACCIEFESSIMARLPEAQLQKLIADVGGDEANLMAALRRTKEISVERLPLPDNALRTEQKLPFVLHVACNSCLDDDHSPSAMLNSQYGDLVREIDAGLYSLMLRIQENYCGIAKGKSNNQILFSQMRTFHGKFLSGEQP
jgi:hypothetical protein